MCRDLSKLDCGLTEITELDLSNVPGLARLRCTGNYIRRMQLTKLDLSNVPGLIELCCRENLLTELSLSNCLGSLIRLRRQLSQ